MKKLIIIVILLSACGKVDPKHTLCNNVHYVVKQQIGISNTRRGDYNTCIVKNNTVSWDYSTPITRMNHLPNVRYIAYLDSRDNVIKVRWL